MCAMILENPVSTVGVTSNLKECGSGVILTTPIFDEYSVSYVTVGAARIVEDNDIE